jgi:phage gp45-like
MNEVDRRLASLFSRGVLSHEDVKAGMAMGQAEFFIGEQRRVEVPQGYGFASRPLPGSELFAVFANGERSAGVALAFDDCRRRPTDLQAGEVALYGKHARDEIGHWIKFTDQPKPNTVLAKARRLELRAGAHFLIVDADDGVSWG